MGLDLKKLLGMFKVTKNSTIQKVEPTSLYPSFGEKINHKIDLTSLNKTSSSTLNALLRERGMLVIPSHRILSDKEQLKITAFFGKVNKDFSFITPHAKKTKNQDINNNTFLSSALWHCDYPYLKRPPHISVFQVIEDINQDWETSFISINDLDKKLHEDIKKKWANIQVMYSGEDVTHPLLWVHPFTGKHSIYFDFRFAKEMFDLCKVTGNVLFENPNEIIYGLNKLFSKNKTVYRHKWKSGDIVIIDNYAISRKETIKPTYADNTTVRRTSTTGVYF